MLSPNALSAFSATEAVRRPGPFRPVRAPGEGGPPQQAAPAQKPLSPAPDAGGYKPRGSLLNLTV